MSINVLLADDESMIRAGLRLVLETDTGIHVVGEAADGNQAVRAAATLKPDVVLMDVRMPGKDGITATHDIVSADSNTRVVVLTTFNEDTLVHAALRAGASGFLLKVAPPERLIDAIHVAAAGDALLDPLVTRRLIATLTTAPTTPAATTPAELNQLTMRERQVLNLLARGQSNAEIADTLTVGDATVKTHVARVLMKLQLRDRVQAVIYAYEHGLVRPGP
jgi:DNA-binding NarL/FixJ family response regulator